MGGYSSNLLESFKFFQIQKKTMVLKAFTNSIFEYKFQIFKLIILKITRYKKKEKYKVKSPVLIIFYNRLDKTKNILENLLKSNNDFTNLYFSVDGPKNQKDNEKIQEVIGLLKNYKQKLNNVKIIVNENNLGLQQNIIKSIDNVLDINDTIIVLEDDHIASPEFLVFVTICLKNLEKMKKYFKYQVAATSQMNIKKMIFFSQKYLIVLAGLLGKTLG